jgi:hypothetical protein
MVRNAVRDYGRGSAGPSYLRNATTCRAVMSVLWRRQRSQLGEPITVVSARLDGASALAVFSSRSMPASEIPLEWRHGVWRIQQLSARPLP